MTQSPLSTTPPDQQGPHRPTKYTPDRVKRILEALRIGCTRTAASRAGSIDQYTFRTWLKNYPEFREAVEDAEGVAEQEHTKQVMIAARKGNVKASMFWLERRRPADYGRIERVEVLVRQQRAQELADELSLEGIDVTPDELLAEYNSLAMHESSGAREQRQHALPAPSGAPVAPVAPAAPVRDLPAFDE